jgi:hypothetical protein
MEQAPVLARADVAARVDMESRGRLRMVLTMVVRSMVTPTSFLLPEDLVEPEGIPISQTKQAVGAVAVVRYRSTPISLQT